MQKLWLLIDLSVLLTINYFFQNWEHPYKVIPTSFIQIKEVLARKEYGENNPYDNQILFLKPIFLLISQKIPFFLNYVNYLLILMILYAKVVLLKTLNLKKNEEFLFEILFLINPYLYFTIINQNSYVFDFVLICLITNYTFQKKNYFLLSIFSAFAIYLNLTNVLFFIFIYSTYNFYKSTKIFILTVICFSLIIYLNYLYLQNWVK